MDSIEARRELGYTTQAQFVERFKLLTKQMVEIVAAKNADYAGSDDAFRNLRRHGLLGVLVRMDDKISRLTGFVEHGGGLKVTDETAINTALDLANYSLILASMIMEQEQRAGRGQFA